MSSRANPMTVDQAKAMIATFRVNELQHLLGFVGTNRAGRKDDLMVRAYQVIEGRNFNDRIKDKIRELYTSVVSNQALQPQQVAVNGMPPRGVIPPMAMYPGIPQLRQSSLGAAALQLRQERHGVPTVGAFAAVQPSQVIMTELPFYEVIGSVLGPVILAPSNPAVKFQDGRYAFNLSVEYINRISHIRDTRPGVKLNYPVQLQVRFCQGNAPAPQPDMFPGNFNMKLNGKPVNLPPTIPSNRQGVEPKRPPKEVDITPLVKLSPMVTNVLEVAWGLDLSKVYAFQIHVVRKLLPDELMKVVKERAIKKEVTKARIREILDADADIATESLRLSLRCPLGKMRMTMPCRAINTCAAHVQCFDASIFLHMNEKKASWACPVCNKSISFKELAVDEYFADVLASPITKECDEVELNVDGTFYPIVVDEEGKKEVKRVLVAPVKAEGIPPPAPAADDGRESPPLVELSDEENDENMNPSFASLPGSNPPPPPVDGRNPSPPPLDPATPASPEIFTIDDDD